MIKKEITLYRFDELKEELKAKILEEAIQNEVEFYGECCLEDFLLEEAHSLLNSLFENVENLKLLYDFSYSQGSGLLTEFTFTFKNELIEVKQNPYNHWYTFNSNFILDYDEFYSKITDDEIKEIKEKIIKVNKQLERLGYDILEDEDFHKENALESLEELGEVYFENGEIYQGGE